MTVAFRSSANVTNGTAGTSVVVTKPTGTADGDILVAFVAETGTGSITKPSGWTLIGSQAASTNVTVACYWKLAASEGASWTWTLGSSVRNWGWVGAYTGVDTASPVASSDFELFTSAGSSFVGPLVSVASGGLGVSAVGAVRAAGGSATTWTGGGTERADLSTNAGAGTDIAGSAQDTANSSTATVSYGPSFTASQSQSSGVEWALALTPAFVTYDASRPVVAKVEAAFGADPDADPTGWTWTDISAYVQRKPGVVIVKGRGPGQRGQANPSEIRLVLNNDGRFTPDNPSGAYYPNITRNTPIRVSVPSGFAPPTERAVAFVNKWSPRWDASTREAVVPIVASGRLRRVEKDTESLRSPMYRSISGSARGTAAIEPAVYWPCEDGSGAALAASAIPGVPAMPATNVTFAAESTLTGSRALPTMSDSASGAAFVGTVPAYAPTGQWCAVFAMRMPTGPAVTTYPVAVVTDGTAALWAIAITPAAPDTVGIRAYDSTGAQILASDTNVTESTFYGAWHLFSLGVKQNGSNVDYTMSVIDAGSSFGVTGTLNSRTHGNALSIRAAANTWTASSGIGHFAVFTAATFSNSLDPVFLGSALDGNTGETAAARFARLCVEEGIDYDTVTAATETSIGMGPQPTSAVATALQECAEADSGLIHDGGTLGALTLVTRASRYNATTALTLDRSSGSIATDFGPEYDDQDLVNDVTASRSGGSSARYANETHATAEGRYKDSPPLNLETDAHLYEIAGWRVGLGTVPGMRVPQLSFNLRRNPNLAQSWLACRIGSRVSGTNLPSTFGPSAATVDAFIEGYTETITDLRWDVTLNCSAARPYDVLILDGTANTGRLEASGSTLGSAITATATVLPVTTTTGNPSWTTASGDRPFDIEVAGERMTVTNVVSTTPAFIAAGTIASGNNASVTPALPAGITPDVGQLLLVWAAIRNSGTGTVDLPSGWTSLVDFGNVRLFGRHYVTGDTAPTVTFTGGVANADTQARMFAFAGVCMTFGSGLGSRTGVPAADGSLNASAQDIAFPALYVAQDNCLALWLGWKQDDWTSVATLAGATEIADNPTITGDDQGIVVDYQLQTTATDVAAGSFTVTGGAAAISRGVVLALRPAQRFTVTRSVNGVVKAQSAGAEVKLWHPSVLAL